MEFALSTCYILSATLLVVEARQLPTMNEQEQAIQKSFGMIEKFE